MKGVDPLVLVLLLVALFNLGLASLVLRAARGPREETRVFSALAISVSLWCFTNALFRLAPTTGLATFWAQLAYLSALSTAASFLHFAWIYPRQTLVSSRWKGALWLVGAGVGLLSFVPGVMVQGVDIEARRILTGPGLFLIAAYMLGTSVLAFTLFFQHQNRLRGRARAQARYVLFGSFLTALLGLTFNLILPLCGDYRFVALGPIFSLFFVGFSGYSIAAHRLFDVRVLIRRTVVYAVLLTLMAGVFAALEKGLEQVLRPLIGGDSATTNILAALLVAMTAEPAKKWLKHRVSLLFFKNEKAEMELFRVSQESGQVKNIEKIH